MWRELQRLSGRALRCARCGAQACSERGCTCGAPPPLAQLSCPFERLALTPRWEISASELREAWLARVRTLQFFFAREPQIALHSERALAAVHEAYERLQLPLERIQVLFELFLETRLERGPREPPSEPPWAGLSSHERTKLWVEISQRQEVLTLLLKKLWEQLAARSLTSAEATHTYWLLFNEFKQLEVLRSAQLEESL